MKLKQKEFEWNWNKIKMKLGPNIRTKLQFRYFSDKTQVELGNYKLVVRRDYDSI